jgi:H+-translocating NAD(P) transhydrogenase subunit alpha
MAISNFLRCVPTLMSLRCVLTLTLLFLAATTCLASDSTLPAATDRMVPAEGNNSGFTRNDAVIASLTIFVLAIFVGNEIITKVPPTLHTPLMSGSNAISGITLVGALIVAGSQQSTFAVWMGFFGIVIATINVVGGFFVTHRMLAMFKRK